MIEVRNPRTGRVDHRFEPSSADEVARLGARLREQQPDWEARGATARADAMLAWRAAMQEHRDELIDALVADTGRLIESALEVDAILGTIERWARTGPELLADPDPKPAAIPIVTVRQGARPYPLVGVISPWNFPLLLGLIDAIPALMAGCSVLMKPSEITPRFIEPLAKTFDGIPIAAVAGAGPTGEAVIDVVDAVCFTGSVPTGKTVAARAAQRFIPAFLELGGKDPAIVLASADLDRASSAILWGGTANAGQSCLSIERVYVARAIHDTFVEQLVAKANAVRLAVPGPGDGEMGPIIAERQIAIIESHLQDARAKGATVRCGGDIERIDGGTYLRPTVLTGVTHDMKVMTEETFGPILPVMAFDEPDDAVRLANDTIFGLSAAVFAGSEDEALAVAARVDAGAISINDAALTALIHDGEKNSFRSSGLGGSRMGSASIRRFFRRQAFLVASTGAPDPWWYPHLRSDSAH